MSSPKALNRAELENFPLPAVVNGDKETKGRILIIAGSREVAGAALLVANAAMRAGAGKLQMAATDAYAQPLAFALPESMVVEARATRSGELSPLAAPDLGPRAERADAVVIGPGLLQEGAAALACALMQAAPETAFVIDAAALTGLARRPDAGCNGRAVLTPHPGEMATLMEVSKEAVQADPEAFARRASDRFQAIVASSPVTAATAKMTHVPIAATISSRNQSGLSTPRKLSVWP